MHGDEERPIVWVCTIFFRLFYQTHGIGWPGTEPNSGCGFGSYEVIVTLWLPQRSPCGLVHTGLSIPRTYAESRGHHESE